MEHYLISKCNNRALALETKKIRGHLMALLFLNRCPLKRGLPPNRLNKMKWRSIKTQPTSDDDGHSEQYEVVFIIFQNTAPSITMMVGGKTRDL